MVRKFSLTVPSARAAEFFLTADLLGGLRSCHRVSDIHPIICRKSLWDICCPQKVPCFLGAPIILRGTDTRLREMSWELLSLTYFLVVHQRIRSLGISSLLSDGITLVAVFPLHYVDEEIIK